MQIAFRGRVFRPSLASLGVALLVCAIAVSLGNWQMRRADEKRQAGAARDAALHGPRVKLHAEQADAQGDTGRRIQAQGKFDPAQTYFLDNRSRDGRPGYEVLTPLRLAGGDVYVLVLRGWLAAPARRDAVPAVQTPAREQVVEGLALAQPSHALEPPGYVAQGRVRQNLTPAEFAAESGLRVLPIVLEQHSDAADGLERNWPRPDAGVDKHLAYAMQWYSLAALAIAIFLVLSFRRPER